MLSIHFTLAQVVNMLRVIADREPDRIGSDTTTGAGCVYATIKSDILTPVCIIGQMFSDLGLLRLLLSSPSETENYYNGKVSNLSACGINGGFWDRVATYGVTFDDDAKEFAHSVQRRQDEDQRWGDAFANAAQAYRDEQQAELAQSLNRLFG